MNLRPSITRLLVLVVAGLLSGCKDEVAEEELLFPEDANYTSWVGRPIAEVGFTGGDLNGAPLDLTKYRGRVLMLDFWASWSPKCMEMFPAKLAVYKQHHHAGLEIVGINADFAREDLDKVLAKENPPWPHHFNRQGEADAAVKKFGITHFPSIWLVDRQGVVRFISGGRNLESKVAQLIAETPVTAATPVVGKAAPSWKERILTTLGGGSKTDPVAARNAVMGEPEAFLDVKNIMITATRRVATVKTPDATHQVVIGKEIAVNTDAGPVALVCKAIESDGLTFVVGGLDTLIKIAF